MESINMANRVKFAALVGLLLLTLCVQTNVAKRGKTRKERRELKAAMNEVAALKEQVTKLGECASRVSELEYHNKALQMISKQNLPQIEENAKQALAKLKIAAADEARWRMYFTVSLLAFLISLSYKGYNYFQLRFSQHSEELRKEKAKMKAEKKRK